MILLAFVPPFGLLAFTAAIWTAIDAARRGQNWFAWSVAVAITGVAFIAWLVVRRRFQPLEAGRSGASGAGLAAAILFIMALGALVMLTITTFVYQVARSREPPCRRPSTTRIG